MKRDEEMADGKPGLAAQRGAGGGGDGVDIDINSWVNKAHRTSLNKTKFKLKPVVI